jgi:hypothetical protein
VTRDLTKILSRPVLNAKKKYEAQADQSNKGKPRRWAAFLSDRQDTVSAARTPLTEMQRRCELLLPAPPVVVPESRLQYCRGESNLSSTPAKGVFEHQRHQSVRKAFPLSKDNVTLLLSQHNCSGLYQQVNFSGFGRPKTVLRPSSRPLSEHIAWKSAERHGR